MMKGRLPDDIVYPSAVAFVLVHLACFGIFWTGVSLRSLVLLVALYFVKMFAITAGYHRLFSHASYRTSRTFRFLLGFLAESSAQAGVIWWAAKHREHHRHSDTELDPHSPVAHGFWISHAGWIFHRRYDRPDLSLVPDLLRAPELVWLDRHKYVPVVALAVFCYAVDGWTGFLVGFCGSTVLTWHGTFAINSLAHVYGRQQYLTGDASRNNFWLAVLTLGEGWHNNHHWYPAAARQGFRWWEWDPTYYLLRLLEKLGVVWDLKQPPKEVLEGSRQIPTSILEKAASRLAKSWRESLGGWKIPELSTLREFAGSCLPQSPGFDRVVQRALEILQEESSMGRPEGREHAF